MGTILLMVAIFVISSIFNGNKKHKEQKSMPPFNNKPKPQMFDLPKQTERKKSTPRSLEDFASEIFQKLNENSTTQTKETIEEIKSHTTVDKVENNPINSNSRPSLDVNRSVRSSKENSSKLSMGDIKQKEIGSFVPTSREALIQAIITSEILGPPKAKQR